MATPSNENLIHARFFNHTIPDDGATRAAGCPKYKDVECVELRFAGNKQTVHVAPAHEVFKRDRNFASGDVTEVTYALAYNEQYKKFKAGEAQDASGTPLAELPFLTQAKRLELKALNVHTAETLAMIDGPSLKMLGMGGRELKNQAQAYLDNAKGSVDVVKMAATIAALQEQVARLTGQQSEGGIVKELDEQPAVSPFADWEAEDLKNWIAEQSGERPKGNPSHATLVKRADEVNADLAKKAKAA